jgi:selenocysteine-specific translation elongation factor
MVGKNRDITTFEHTTSCKIYYSYYYLIKKKKKKQLVLINTVDHECFIKEMMKSMGVLQHLPKCFFLRGSFFLFLSL